MGLIALAPDWTAFVYGLPAPLPAPAPQPLPEPLPPLEEVPCDKCAGEGFIDEYEAMLAEPSPRRCNRCYGRKTVEVCGSCRQVPEVRGGLEVCGC